MICNRFKECCSEARKGNHRWCECISDCLLFSDKRSKPKCEEGQKTYCIENPDRRYHCQAYHIDGGVVKTEPACDNHPNRCDYILLIYDLCDPTAILVELKGKNTSHAVDQISSTISLFEDFLCACNRVFGRIVHTPGAPNIQNNPKTIELKRRLRKLNGNLRFNPHRYEEEYDGLD